MTVLSIVQDSLTLEISALGSLKSNPGRWAKKNDPTFIEEEVSPRSKPTGSVAVCLLRLTEIGIIFKGLFIFILCVFLSGWMDAHSVHDWCPQGSEENTGSPGTGVKDSVKRYVGTVTRTQVL